jgi:tetratricopeptide (TPR) repeat protein
MPEPVSAIGHFNLGNELTAAGRTAEAARCFLTAITLDPGLAEAAVNLSGRLRQLGAPEAAVQAAGLALNAAPALPHAHLALGSALYDLGQFSQAEASLRAALQLQPAWSTALANLGLVLAAQSRLHDALGAYDAAVAHAPDNVQARFGRATCLLALGDFARGWQEFSVRAEMPEAQHRGFTQPVWRGEAATGRTLLVHAEQGFGDTLQFVRFVPRIAERAGARVILEVQPELVRLLGCLPGIDRVIPRGATPPDFDLHIRMLDLAGIFAPTIEALAPAHPYLRADPGLVAARPLPPAEGALRIGLVWAGQSRPDQPHAFAMDRRRSLTLSAFAPLAPLCRAGAIKLFSLQHGPPADQLKAAPDGLDVTDAMSGISDFADTAAIVSQLDLVIAVDTSTAHLAAGLGREVWLLSRYDACWRWLHGRSDSPWYPSMTLLRQPHPGDWSSAMTAATAMLVSRLNRTTS